MKKKVVVIGAGEIGVAVGDALSAVGHEVLWWDSESGKVMDQKPLVEILPAADFVLYCVPSWALRSAIVSTYSHLQPEGTAVALTKGIENKTHKLTSDLLSELLPSGQNFAVLGGPLLAEELVKKNSGFVLVGTRSGSVTDSLIDLFGGSLVKIVGSADPRSVALAGVLKNIYTFAIAFSDALRLGENARGFLVSTALAEMVKIFSKLELDSGVALGPAGLGDFVSTALSAGSRNRQTATEIVSTGRMVNKSEGAASVESLVFLLGGNIDSYPLLHLLAEVILDRADARTMMTNFLNEHGTR